MVFHKGIRSSNGGIFGKLELRCFECGVKIEFGDVFYSWKLGKGGNKNPRKHLCEACYERKWIEC
jgi:hypothetical protein